MLNRIWALFAVASIVCAAKQVLLSNEGAYLEEWTDYARSLLTVFKAPGVSVAVLRDYGNNVEFINAGHSTEDGRRSSEDTLYCIGSTSKAFQSASIGLLIDDYAQGRNVTPLPPGVSFSWDTKAQDLLGEEWGLPDEWASSKASLRDLLSHVTGMPRHEFSYHYQQDVEDVVHRLRYLRPAYELREQWSYNNQMYMTLSYITARYSNQSYPSFVEHRIFDPLGMNSSTFYPQTAAEGGNLVHWFIKGAGKHQNETRRIPYWLGDRPSETTIKLMAGPGGIISSTKDLAAWAKVFLKQGVHDPEGKQIVPRSVIDTVTTGRSVGVGKAPHPERSALTYGFAWVRESYQGHELVWHNGGAPGFNALISLYPNDGLGIVLLTNGDAMPLLNSLSYRIVEDILRLKRVDWPARFLAQLQERASSAKPSLPPQKLSSTAVIPLSHFTGTYSDPGYGNLTLCSFPINTSTSIACTVVLAEFSTVLPSLPPDTVNTTLFASLPSTHMTLTRASDTDLVFHIQTQEIYPEGYGKDKTPFYVLGENYDSESLAEFGLGTKRAVKGIGMWGITGGPAERVPGRPEQSSEVWFEKLT